MEKNDEVMAILIEARDAIEAAMDVLVPPLPEEAYEAAQSEGPLKRAAAGSRLHMQRKGKR